MPMRAGFTLVEMMVVVLIAAIVLTAGVPALQQMVRRQRLTGAADDFFHAAHLTRATALRRGRTAEMVPPQGADWRQGWRIVVNGNEVLMTRPALAPGIDVSSTAEQARVRYLADGRPAVSGTWRFTDGATQRWVIINFLGRIRICDPAPTGSC
ncbi:GspH/FimT family pseudopilin [Herbaspirillum sp. YR522]|uniref:GspH/FimT family pseudopilin n=1 Tax=Herbaspirillum sp. YR522 TaxID=1144342 RepID=UPI00026F7F08|nr:GspH/FimT family pseudopilin [Herbaspirillum sp. YR522]EJN10041.1 prepilin-type N-terminal cleavage/methylation domain-containing protein [Herbaspirillum sp. YR522]